MDALSSELGMKKVDLARALGEHPYAEALFRTLKYRPGYPRKPFASIDAARAWVAGFVLWYNG